MIYMLLLLGCSFMGTDGPNKKPAPSDNTADVDWPVPLKCAGVESGDPSTDHPEYWPIMPDCRLPIGLQFKGNKPDRHAGYPAEHIPDGAAHQWCPADKDGSQKYQMRVTAPTLYGELKTRYVRGRLVNGKPDGTFKMMAEEKTGGPMVTGRFKAGKATGKWSWGISDVQQLCAEASGQMKNGTPVGDWKASTNSGILETFEGTWTKTGWQGVLSMHPGGETVTKTQIKDSKAQK